MATDYEKRLSISLGGDTTTQFFTESGTHIATGYKRIVRGGRGPYVEFVLEQLVKESLYIPEDTKWRQKTQTARYNELRTKDESDVKVYHQKKTVGYADYKIGFFYITLFELVVDGKLIITPLRAK